MKRITINTLLMACCLASVTFARAPGTTPISQRAAGAFYSVKRLMMTEDQSEMLVQQAIQMDQRPGAEWKRRDEMEEKLVSLGTQALGAMQAELGKHADFENDALQVAIFRLQNADATPAEHIRDWGVKFFHLENAPDSPREQITFFHIMDGDSHPATAERNNAALRQVFPNHLFFAVECVKPKQRVVVALSSDGKVQPLSDDAALTKFFRGEAGPQTEKGDRERLALCAAQLTTSREINVYFQRSSWGTIGPAAADATVELKGITGIATITCDAKGNVESLTTKIDKKPAATQTAPAMQPSQ